MESTLPPPQYSQNTKSEQAHSDKPYSYNSLFGQTDTCKSWSTFLASSDLEQAQKYCTIEIWFSSNDDPSSNPVVEWQAKLLIAVRSMTTLMKKGLFCEEANMYRTQGRIFLDQTFYHSEIKDMNWNCSRRYQLSSRLTESSWKGTFNVYARDIRVLSEFRLSHLSANRVYHAAGYKPGREKIYHFNARFPNTNFNIIYDDMPMNGLWPWPKKEQSAETDQDESGKRLFKFRAQHK